MTKKLNWTYILIVVIAVGALFMGGVLQMPALSIGQGQWTTQPQPQAPALQTCEGSAALSLTYNIFDSSPGNQTTSLNGDYNIIVYENGSYKTMVSAGSAISTVPNATLTLYAIDDAGDSTVYGFSDVVQMQCNSITKSEPKGMTSSTLTPVMYDMSTGSQVANTAGAPTTLGAGQGPNGKLYVSVTTPNARFGTTEGEAMVLVVMDYNSLIYKQPAITSVEGGTATIDVVPNGHIPTAVTAHGTGSVAYLIETDRLSNLNNLSINFRAETLTALTNPAATDGNVGITLYDSEMYQSAAGPWVVGFRNMDTGDDLGRANVTDVFHVE
jgi:hypothetical protein